jgi:hypothetical protein
MSMSTGKRVLLGCGIAFFAVAGGFVLMIGGCFGLIMKGAADFPAYAKAEVANPANKDVTDRINTLIVESTSLGQAQLKLGAEAWPSKVLYIGVKLDESSAEFKDAFKATTWSSHSEFQMNGNGYGSLGTPSGKKEIIIIQRGQETGNGIALKYELYIEHAPGS